jgi:hypothetical protein
MRDVAWIAGVGEAPQTSALRPRCSSNSRTSTTPASVVSVPPEKSTMSFGT